MCQYNCSGVVADLSDAAGLMGESKPYSESLAGLRWLSRAGQEDAI